MGYEFFFGYFVRGVMYKGWKIENEDGCAGGKERIFKFLVVVSLGFLRTWVILCFLKGNL